MVKSVAFVPEIVATKKVRSAVPVFCNVSTAVEEALTATVPKSSGEGENETTGALPAAKKAYAPISCADPAGRVAPLRSVDGQQGVIPPEAQVRVPLAIPVDPALR